MKTVPLPSNITFATMGGRDLFRPTHTPEGETWVYQIGLPLQLGPNTAGIFTNIRRCGANVVDLEVGNDLVVFDQLERPADWQAFPINRTQIIPHPVSGKAVRLAVYPIGGGFVPLGALRADGSPHPHAGTGFGLCSLIGFPADDSAKRAREVGPDHRMTCFCLEQYAWDGRTFRVTDSRRVEFDGLIDGYQIVNRGLSNAIADGDDLINGLVACRPGQQVNTAGLARWRRIDDARRLVSYTPVTGEDGAFEPTLVRDADGSLLFTARGCATWDRGRGSQPWRSSQPDVPPDAADYEHTIRVWRSSDNGATWHTLIEAHDVRAGTPTSINITPDGSPYIAGNPRRTLNSRGQREPSILMRESLMLWPLAADRRSLLQPVTARDCNAQFGPTTHGTIWYVDHPVGGTLRLRDGQWRHLLFSRLLEKAESQSHAPPTPHTGTYIEEVWSNGAGVITPWRFE